MIAPHAPQSRGNNDAPRRFAAIRKVWRELRFDLMLVAGCIALGLLFRHLA